MVQVDGQETKVAARLTHKVFFERDDIEFTFQWLLSFVHCGGVSQGEVFKLARNIDPNSLASWKTEFEQEAVKIEATAEDCLKKGHLISASEAFIRAHSYYRAAFYGAFPDEPDFARYHGKSVECFRKALDAKSEQIPHEWVEVEYKGYKFPGCFLKAEHGNAPKPTIIFHNGGETHKEDTYFLGGQAAIDRGYNALIVDLPYDVCVRFYEPEATARNFPREELYNVYRATTDFVLARPDVDPERLVVSGMSYGGAKTMVHASCDDRFAAAVPNSPVYSMATFIERGMPSFLRGTSEEAAEQSKKMPYTGQVLFAGLAWSHGLDSIAGWHGSAGEVMEVDPKDVKCPLLSMYSEAEHPEMQRQAIDTFEQAPNEKNAIFKGTEEDGADLHCQLNNLPLSYQVMFDWLDEVLDYNIQIPAPQ